MTAPRERVWFTAAGTNNTYGVEFENDLNPPMGTTLRLVGSVQFDTQSTPPAGDQFLAMGWGFNVGTASLDPIAGGTDPESTLIRKLLILPGMAGGTQTSQTPLQSFDIETQRIIDVGETLWFAAETVQPAVSWFWAFEVRVLILLP